MSATDRARAWVASRHGRFFAARLAAAAEKYLKAYNNLGNMDMTRNGELNALRLVLRHVEGEVIDAGANEGQWLRAVHPFAAGRTIHSFEPVPQTFTVLRENAGHLPGVRLVNAGLGAREEDIVLNVNPLASDMASAYPVVDWQEGARPVRCRITTGDAYLRRRGIAQVALLKIDVEGMEADCLSGFEESFRAGGIACGQFEHGPSHVYSGHTLKYFLDWMEERGMTLFRVFPGKLEPLRYNPRRESFEVQNLFAIRRDVVATLGL